MYAQGGCVGQSGGASGGNLMQQLLQLKRQQAALLFSAWDREEEGRVLLAHVRPILLALFPGSIAPSCRPGEIDDTETPKASAQRVRAETRAEWSGPRPHTPPPFAPTAAPPEAPCTRRDEEEAGDAAADTAVTCSTTTTCDEALAWPRVKHAYRRLSGRPWRSTQHVTLSELYAMMDYLCDYDAQTRKERVTAESRRGAVEQRLMTPFYTGAVLLFDERQLATDTPEPRPAVPRATAQHPSLTPPPPPARTTITTAAASSSTHDTTLPSCAAVLLRGTIERAFADCRRAAGDAGIDGVHAESDELLALDTRTLTRLGNHLLGRPFSIQEGRALGRFCREMTAVAAMPCDHEDGGATQHGTLPRPHEAALTCDALSLDQFVRLVTQC